MRKILVALILPLVFLAGCSKDDDGLTYEEQFAIDQQKIIEFLELNEITHSQSTQNGVHYMIDQQGMGDYPTIESVVKVQYTGVLMSNGYMFDAGTIQNVLSQFIPGWQYGIPMFREGGRGTIIIPSGLAYGKDGYYPDIPANANLVFTIELLEVN